MALKDWKKVGKNEWQKSGYTTMLEIIKSNNKIPYLVIRSSQNYDIHRETVLKQFKTKQQALRFAKAYMRKH